MSRKVREIWWDNKDLHVVFDDDGSEKIYKNAYMTKMVDGLVLNDGLDDRISSGSTYSIERVRFLGDNE